MRAGVDASVGTTIHFRWRFFVPVEKIGLLIDGGREARENTGRFSSPCTETGPCTLLAQTAGAWQSTLKLCRQKQLAALPADRLCGRKYQRPARGLWARAFAN